ncbi:hypothetical protein Pedsa_1033 [Pseudopedobacter saltans DSM 12145]|uniref:Uncharacterized protein n=1 Tax=Pseudopedobacter saltans (strain ATCC 51119 / DSM 12145 / JCM 21818 / CCUG 39354 / LMG 10337 / NBRC 100064 / NCIMB 13643) TaxID=762903 RepID=F0SBF8_PSESL|nr:hypothetical protein Pedsa_1033 [Pseudopedobacter saltans DSM 12145]
MKIRPDKAVLDKDFYKKKMQNNIRKAAITLVFIAIYFFFFKLLFL